MTIGKSQNFDSTLKRLSIKCEAKQSFSLFDSSGFEAERGD